MIHASHASVDLPAMPGTIRAVDLACRTPLRHALIVADEDVFRVEVFQIVERARTSNRKETVPESSGSGSEVATAFLVRARLRFWVVVWRSGLVFGDLLSGLGFDESRVECYFEEKTEEGPGHENHEYPVEYQDDDASPYPRAAGRRREQVLH